MAMLNSERNTGFGAREFNVVWLQPLAAPTIIAACGPLRISAAMSTTYDTDMLEPLAMGNWILNADVNDDSSTRNNSGTIGVKAARDTSAPKVPAPSTMTAKMYQRPRGGRSRSKAPPV